MDRYGFLARFLEAGAEGEVRDRAERIQVEAARLPWCKSLCITMHPGRPW